MYKKDEKFKHLIYSVYFYEVLFRLNHQQLNTTNIYHFINELEYRTQMPTSSPDLTSDVLVIGSGAAGLFAALKLANQLKVTLVTKTELGESNTRYAQGGIAAVLADDDSIEAHINDTLKAGGDLCHYETVLQVATHGASAIRDLQSFGVNFNTENGHLHLTREGGHSTRRIAHVADHTGFAVQSSLSKQALNHPNINILTRHHVIDLILASAPPSPSNHIQGAWVFDLNTKRVVTLAAKFVILASGGASKAYLYTSNPDITSGDGIAMAYRAGCEITNMEFNQFHPTCLYHEQARSFLLSEALRGEGAQLKLPNQQTRFMFKYHQAGELAPRDIVARSIDQEMKKNGLDFVHLDFRHKPKSWIKTHFPTIQNKLKQVGLDLSKDLIPVVPAAHYTCGGVQVNLHGETNIAQLYAIGEVSHTGLHGANRIASNSLLECIVYAKLASADICSKQNEIENVNQLPTWNESRITHAREAIQITHNWDELRRTMWNYVGIVRSDERLAAAKQRIDLLYEEINDYYNRYRITMDLLECRNLTTVADLIVRSAMLRKECRGLHYTLDYPLTLEQAQNSTILKTR